MPKKPIINRVFGRIRGFRKKYIVDVPAEKEIAFLVWMEEFGLKAIEKGAEGGARGLKS